MKKILSAILAGVMLCTTALMFSACGGSNNSSNSSEASDSSTTEGKELHMATNAAFEPYEFVEGGKVVGIDAEIAQAICDKLGYKLVIDDMDFDAIITAVTSGKADFGMAGMTITDERKESVDFTTPYTNAVQVIIVNEENSKVEVRYLTSVVGVEGNTLLTGITFRNNETGESWTEHYDEGSFGVFVFVGRDPETSLVSELAELDAQGYAITDDRMATRTPGLFCAGDMRVKPLRQIITAAADGAIAATSAASFLGQPIEG